MEIIQTQPSLPNKQISKSLGELANDTFCDICFEYLGNQNEEFLEDGSFMMFCYKCGLSVHNCCYGLQTQYEIDKNQYDEKIARFTCERCLLTQNEISIIQECILCGRSTGSLKKCSDDKWIHIYCALLCDLVLVEDFAQMKINSHFLEKYQLTKSKIEKACVICYKKGQTVVFTDQEYQQERYAHPYCAMVQKLNTIQQQDNQNNKQNKDQKILSVDFELVYNDQAEFQVDENDDILDKMIVQLCNQYEFIGSKSTKIQDILDSVYHGQILDENEEIQIKQKSSGSKGKIHEKNDIVKELQTFIKSTIKKGASPSKGKGKGKKSATQKLWNYNLTRGGKIQFLVKNIDSENTKEEELIINQWKQFTKQHIIPELTDGESHKEFDEEFQKVLAQSGKLISLRDIILLGVLLQKRIYISQRKLLQVKYLQEITEIGFYLPLNFQNSIINIIRRIYVGLSADYLCQRVIKNLKPISVYNNQQGQYIQENWVQNQNILYIYNELENLYKSSICNVETPNYNKLSKQQQSKSPYSKVLTTKQTISTLIGQDIPSEPTFSQITLMLSEINGKLIDQNKYPEIKQIQEIIKKQQQPISIIIKIQQYQQDNVDSFELLRVNDSNIFEENSEKYMNKLLERPMNTVVQKTISKLKLIPQITPEEINQYETNIIETEKWIAFYQQNLQKQKPFIEFERMIQSISELSVISKEVIEAVKQYISFKKWYFNIQRILVQVKKKTQSRQNDKIKRDIELMQISEVQSLIQQYQESQIVLREDDSVLDELLQAIDFANSIQDQIKRFLLEGGEIEDLRQIENNYVQQGFYIPEYYVLQEKIKINEETKNLLFNPSDIIDIQHKLQASEGQGVVLSTFEKNILSELQRKYSVGKELQILAINLLKYKNELEPDDVSLLNNVITQTKQNNILFGELIQCKNIIKECHWLYKIYAIFTNQYINSNQTEPEIFLQCDMFAEFILYVQSQIVNLEYTLDSKQFSVLKMVQEEGRKIQFFDQRIKQIYYSLSNVIWKYQVQEFQSRQTMKYRELQQLVLLTPSQLIESRDILYAELKEKYQEIKNWQQTYENIVENQEIEQVMLKCGENMTNLLIDKQEQKLIEIQRQVNDLQRGYIQNRIYQYSDLEYDANVTNRLKKIVDGLVQCGPLMKLIRQNTTNVSLIQLKQVLSDLIEAGVSESMLLIKKIKEQIEVSDEHIRRIIAKAQLSSLSYEEANEILSQLNEETENENVLSNVKLQLEQNVGVCNEIDKRLNKLVNQYQIVPELFQSSEEILSIQEEIDQLKKDIYRSPLDMPEQSKIINKFSWTFQANELLYGNINTNKKTLRQWIDLLQDPSNKYNSNQLKLQIQEQVNQAVSLIKKTSRIKNQEEKRKMGQDKPRVTKEDITQLYQQVQNCKIGLESEQVFLMGILEKVSKLMNQLDSVFKAMPKAPVNAFKKLQQSIQKLPVDMSKYQKLIEQALRNYEELDYALQDVEIIDSNQALNIINDYQNCNVLVPKAERVQYAYEISQGIIRDIESRLNQSAVNNQPGAALTLNEIKQLQVELQENILIGTGNNYIQLRVKLYILRIACLRNSPLAAQLEQVGNMPPAEVIILNTRVKTPTRLTMPTLQPEEIKNLLIEGYALQNYQHRNVFLADCVAFLEKLVNKIEEIEREICQIKDIDLLSSISTIFLQHIDLRQTIQSYVIQINRDPYYSPDLRSIIIYNEKDYEQIQLDQPYLDINQAPLPNEIQSILSEVSKGVEYIGEDIQENYQYEPTDYSNLEIEIDESSVLTPLQALQKSLKKKQDIELEEEEPEEVESSSKATPIQVKSRYTTKQQYSGELDKANHRKVIIGQIHNNLKLNEYLKNQSIDLVELSERIEGKIWEEFGENMNIYQDKIDKLSEVLRISTDLKYVTQRFVDTDWDIQIIEHFYRQRNEIEQLDRNLTHTQVASEVKQHQSGQPLIDKRKQLAQVDDFIPEFSQASKQYKIQKITTPITEDATKINNKKISKSTLLQIYRGDLQFGSIQFPVQLLTRSNYQITQKLPSIISQNQSVFNIESKVAINFFEQYIEKILSKSGNDRPEIIVFGTVYELQQGNNTNELSTDTISHDLLKTQKVGVTRYTDSSMIFFLNIAQVKDEWFRKPEFRFKVSSNDLQLGPLVFIATSKLHKIKDNYKNTQIKLIELNDVINQNELELEYQQQQQYEPEDQVTPYKSISQYNEQQQQQSVYSTQTQSSGRQFNLQASPYINQRVPPMQKLYSFSDKQQQQQQHNKQQQQHDSKSNLYSKLNEPSNIQEVRQINSAKHTLPYTEQKQSKTQQHTQQIQPRSLYDQFRASKPSSSFKTPDPNALISQSKSKQSLGSIEKGSQLDSTQKYSSKKIEVEEEQPVAAQGFRYSQL